MGTRTIDTAALKSQINLPALVGQSVPLRKVADTEFAGSCPRCGGVDRLHINNFGWMCRQCQPKWSDAIAWLRWLHDVSFTEAIEMLGGSKAMPNVSAAPVMHKSAPPPRGWDDATRQRHLEHLERCQTAFSGSQGEEYLIDRGFTPETWQAYGLGFDARREAIAIPWFRGGRLVALNYRRIHAQAKGDRFTAEAGGSRSGVLFGGQALCPGLAEYMPNGSDPLAQRSLILVEGEFNCMSIWQAVWPLVDVLSFGAEGGSTPENYLPIAARYRCVIVWKDEEDKAKAEARRIAGAGWISSVKGDAKRDANDRLQDLSLRPVLASLLRKATKPEHQQALRYDLQDAGLS